MQNSNTPCTIYFSLIVRETIPRAETRGMGSYQYHFASDPRKMEKQCVVHHKVDISTTDESDHQELSQAEITAWSIFEQIGFSFAIVLSIYSIYFVVYLLFFKSGNKIY